jgi:hypothetical protein
MTDALKKEPEFGETAAKSSFSAEARQDTALDNSKAPKKETGSQDSAR